MQPATTISGTVYAGAGTTTPLSDVCVVAEPKAFNASDENDYYTATTTSAGTYELTHVAPISGGYTVYFRDCGAPVTYVPQYYGGDYSLASASTLTPTVAAPSSGIDGHLTGGGAIEGTITDASGQAITSGVCADAETQDGTDGSYGSQSASVSGSGAYEIGGLPSGDYSVSFYDCGPRNDLSQTLPGTVHVTIGQPTTGVNVSMQPAATISGHVYGGAGTGTPLGGICVVATDDTTGQLQTEEVYTAADGSYTFDHILPSDSYTVQFDNAPQFTGCVVSGVGVDYAGQFYDGVADAAQAAPVTATVAVPATGIDAHLSGGGPVTTITGGPANDAQTNATTATFAFAANESGATYECALDSGTYTACTSPFTTGTLANGNHTFSVEATADGVTEAHPPSVTWTIASSSSNSTAQGTVNAGEPFSSDPGGQPSASTPVVTNITLPAAGELTLTNQPSTTQSANGYTVIGQQVDIAATAPDGTGSITGTAADPIKLSFLIAASEIPAGTPASGLTVERNGVPAGNCTGPAGSAVPDPCVSSRSTLAGGDVEIDVLTTHCSTWNIVTTPEAPKAGSPGPVLSGTAAVGSMLSTTTGSFSGTGLTYSYVWLRDGSPITGAGDLPSYKVVPADAGHALSVQVMATNGGGSASATSNSLDVPAAPVAGSPGPVLSGTAAVGSMLSTTTGSFSGTGLTYSYVWLRDGSPITGAGDLPSYKVVPADAGHALSVQVMATNGGGSASATSNSLDVPAAPVAGSPGPVLSGTAAVGSMLSTTTGSFSGTGLTYSYVWLRDGSPITGAGDLPSYKVVPADAGHALSVQVMATNGGGSASATSNSLDVPAAPVAGSPGPVLSGTAAVGSMLSTTTGSFTGTGLTYSYVWLRDGSPIGGAAGSSYMVVSADAGHALSVQVTATNGGGSATSAASNSLDVPAAPVAGSPGPVLSGTPAVGSMLSTTTGSFTGTGLTYSYVWLRDGSPISGAGDLPSYKVVSADAGHALSVQVTAMNGGGSATSATSNTENVPDITPMVVSAPVISGTPAVGSTLNASTGAFVGGGLTYSYVWLRDGSPIGGATGSAYSVVSADAGHALSVQVTATNGLGSVPATSAAVSIPAPSSSGGGSSGSAATSNSSSGSGGSSGSGSSSGSASNASSSSGGSGGVSASSTRSPGLVLRLAPLKLPRLKKLLKSGLDLAPTCTVACILTIRLTVGEAEATKLHLTKRRTVVVIATAQARLSGAGPEAVVIHLTSKARRALAGTGRLTATLTVMASGGGVTSTVTRSLTLRK